MPGCLRGEAGDVGSSPPPRPARRIRWDVPGPPRGPHMNEAAMVPGYLEHLTDSDVRLLAQATGSDAEPLVGRLRSDPTSAQRVLSDPAVFDRLFGTSPSDPLLVASPFLVFAVIVHRAARDLEQATFVHERTTPRQRV